MKPIEIKKCELKLNSLIKSIKNKENDKKSKNEQIDSKKKELRNLSSQIRKSKQDRDRISEELNNQRLLLEKTQAEIYRIKAGLIYKTRQQYEEMIKHLENEMQSNYRTFSIHEESRLLNEIRNLRQSLQQLELYEEKKKVYDNLKESFNEKKSEQQETWKNYRILKQTLTTETECHNILVTELQNIEADLNELNKSKVDLKKQLEDLIRENVLKQQQAKKLSAEKNKYSSQKSFEDEVVISMELTLRDYNQLINYFYKLQNNEDLTESGNLLSLSSSSNATTPTLFNMNKHDFLSYSLPTESFSLKNLNIETDNQIELDSDEKKLIQDLVNTTVNNNNRNDNSNDTSANNTDKKNSVPFLQHPTSLFLRKSEDFTSCQTPKQIVQTPTYPLLPFNLINSPIDENSACPNALFILKKKDDMNEPVFNSNRRRSCKKTKQNKALKKPHPVEIITLLSKLEIPLQLSSQADECVRVLRARRDQIQHELNLYKTISLKQQQQLQQQQTVENDLESLAKSSIKILEQNQLNNNLINDTQSEESSCLDSNYESDTNSLKQGAMNDEKYTNNLEIKEQEEINELEQDNINNLTITSLNGLEKLIKQPTLLINHNSDDSDATIYDNALFNKRKSSKSNSQASSTSSSDKTVTPTSPTSLKRVETDQVHTFKRQLSDGYSSSYTPLSASSVNSEQAGLNPFFKNINQ